MAYINNKKVIQVVKTVETAPRYKHSVKMQGTYSNIAYTVYAEIISTDATNWATAGCAWDDIAELAANGWDGIIAGYNDGDRTFQYASLGASAGLYQSELFYDIENLTVGNYETIDASVLDFIEDTVTPIN